MSRRAPGPGAPEAPIEEVGIEAGGEPQVPHRGRARRLFAALRSVLTIVAAAVVFFVLLAVVLVPLLFGWTPLTVRTGSMEPTIPVGSQVVVSPIESDEEVSELREGDVITFLPYPDDPTTVTHRVEQRSLRADGMTVIRTRGDASDTQDPWTLTTDQIRGQVRYHIPLVGYPASLLDSQQKSVGVIAIIAALICYGLWQILQLVREHRRRRSGGGDSTTA